MKAIKIILISLSIILFSCSSDDNSDLPEILPETIKLVKSEKLSDTNKVEYLYNDNNLISSSTGVSNNITWVEYAIYNSNQDIIKLNSQESGSSTYSNIYVFNYDSQNRLINYSAKTEDVNLEYNGNKVILTGRIEGYFDSEAELELNNAGIITKFIENNQYTIFEYDTKGNMTTAKSYDNNNNLTQEFSISYDNKINPFYNAISYYCLFMYTLYHLNIPITNKKVQSYILSTYFISTYPKTYTTKE